MTALGILGLDRHLTTRSVHPRGSWIGGWNLSPLAHHVRAVGDLDGDGRSEFIITSDWGFGVLAHDGTAFTQRFGAPRSTDVEGWSLDDPRRPGRDRVVATGRFSDRPHDLVMIWSSQGAAVLRLEGSRLVLHWRRDNAVDRRRWFLNTRVDRYCGAGRFFPGGQEQIVVMGPSGLGIVPVGSEEAAIVAVDGQRLGSWTLNLARDRVVAVADLDGDGEDELVLERPGRTGVLKLRDRSLTAMIHHRWSPTGGPLGEGVKTTLAGRFRPGQAEEILVKDHRGLQVVGMVGDRLIERTSVRQLVRVDGWIIDTLKNFLLPVGDLSGDGADDVLIRSPWGIGILSARDAIRCRTLHAYREDLGGWALAPSDVVCGAGAFTGGPGRELLLKRPLVVGAPAPPTRTVAFVNWHGNVRRSLPRVRPVDLGELVAAVGSLSGRSVGVAGSGWSYTECVVGAGTQALIDTSGLGVQLSGLVPDVVDETIDGSHVLVHVEAGIKLHALNCRLNTQGYALQTMGGSRGQSLAGVMGTGVHGSDVDLPPVADAVRAIHLVGAGGRQWWLESATRPLTTAAQLEVARAKGLLDPAIAVAYDDDLFRAALVGLGCAGVIYSVVVECRRAFRLQTTTVAESWVAAQRRIADLDRGDSPRYLEINLNPADGSCRTTIREETTLPSRRTVPARAGLSIGAIAGAVGLLGPGAVALLTGAVADYVGRTTAEIAALAAFAPFLAARRTEEALRPVQEAQRLLTQLGLAAVDPHNPRRVADLLPTVINLFWQIGLFVVDGRMIVDRMQSMFTAETRPEETWIGPSYHVMTGQPICPADGTQTHDETEKLVEGYEYAVPAARALEFAQRLVGAVQEVRRGPDAVVVNLNLRFTRSTRAHIGMQAFDRTCHVEIYTFRGLRGNDAFRERLGRIVAEFGAMPHWGQLHRPEDAAVLRGTAALRRWQTAMRRFANGNNMFLSPFARSRGLI